MLEALGPRRKSRFKHLRNSLDGPESGALQGHRSQWLRCSICTCFMYPIPQRRGGISYQRSQIPCICYLSLEWTRVHV